MRSDALSSVRRLVDESGAVVLSRSYEPYGEILASAGEVETDFAFTGEQLDRYSGLLYLRARWYAPAMGRFTSKDLWLGEHNRPITLFETSLFWWIYIEKDKLNKVRVDENNKFIEVYR